MLARVERTLRALLRSQVLWVRAPATRSASRDLLASSSTVGLIDQSFRRGAVLDAASGKELWVVPFPIEWHGWVLAMGELLVVLHERTLHGFEPRTGRSLWELQIAPRSRLASCDGDGLVLSTEKEVRFLRVEEPARSPVLLWRTRLEPEPASRAREAHATCGGGLVVVRGPAGHLVLDAATGARRFAPEQWVRGVVVDEGACSSVASRRRRSGPSARMGCPAPSPRALQRSSPFSPTSRSSGRTPCSPIDRSPSSWWWIAGDQLHLICPRVVRDRREESDWSTIVAVGLGGQVRWRLELDLPAQEAGVESLAVTDGRLYALTRRSTVIAIGEQGAAS